MKPINLVHLNILISVRKRLLYKLAMIRSISINKTSSWTIDLISTDIKNPIKIKMEYVATEKPFKESEQKWPT